MGRRGPPRVITALAGPGELRAGAEIVLAEAEAHHLRVRRAAVGEEVRLLDGRGGRAVGTLTATGARTAVRIGAVEQVAVPPGLRLVVGAGDRERFGWLAEKCAELGVTELVPLAAARSASVAGRVQPNHLDRLRRQAREAIKQSGAAWAPVVGDAVTVADLCAAAPGGIRWLADAGGVAPPVVSGEAVTVVVGPEGGLTSEEVSALTGSGYHPVRLGLHTLRFETAAVVAAALARVPRA